MGRPPHPGWKDSIREGLQALAVPCRFPRARGDGRPSPDSPHAPGSSASGLEPGTVGEATKPDGRLARPCSHPPPLPSARWWLGSLRDRGGHGGDQTTAHLDLTRASLFPNSRERPLCWRWSLGPRTLSHLQSAWDGVTLAIHGGVSHASDPNAFHELLPEAPSPETGQGREPMSPPPSPLLRLLRNGILRSSPLGGSTVQCQRRTPGHLQGRDHQGTTLQGRDHGTQVLGLLIGGWR